MGLKESDIDAVWEELGMEKGAAVGLCVRSIRACPGTTFCKLGKQDALGIDMERDRTYHAAALPGKFKMAVSGCKLSCSESWVRDIGLIGFAEGWTLTIGGNVGMTPRIGKELKTGLDDDQVMTAVEKVIAVYNDQAKAGERLGKMIERVGLEPFESVL